MEGLPFEAVWSMAYSSEEPCPPARKASLAKLVRLRSSPAMAAIRTTRGKGTERK
jgi:hypothetical protein